MSAAMTAPPCLALPEPSFRIYDDANKHVHPSQAGYVLHQNRDYWIEVTLAGAAPDQWSVRAGRKPEFIASAPVEDAGSVKRVKISTGHRTTAWSSHFWENGADFTLTVQHESDELPQQQINVPFVPAKPQLTLYMLIVTTVVPMLWSFLHNVAPQFRENVYFPDGWAPRVMLVSACLFLVLIVASWWCCYLLPLSRVRALRHRAREKVDISSWVAESAP